MAFSMLACQRNETDPAPVNPYAAQIKTLHTIFTATLYEMAKNPGFRIRPAATSASSITTSIVENAQADEPTLVEGILEIEAPLTDEQIEISDDFINQVWNAGTTGIQAIADEYENKVANSSLTEEEKLELFVIAESIRVTAEFLESSGADIVYDFIGASLPPGEDVPEGLYRDSCLDLKDIMQGAVYAGFGNAIIGGFYGCTAGTFTVPVIGTATGCVGGAVFGFANGFFGATIAGAGQQILFRCLLKDGMVFDPETGEYIDTVQRTKAIIEALERFKREQEWKSIRRIVFSSLL